MKVNSPGAFVELLLELLRSAHLRAMNCQAHMIAVGNRVLLRTC